MRIAIMGIRGIPANYGGFETFAEELSTRLVKRGHDGIERLRKKWNILGKIWYRVGEWFSTVFPNEMVSDARVIEQYYLKEYRKKSTLIPYGASTDRVNSTGALERFGVVFTGYVFGVGYKELQCHALAYVHATEVGGTHPALIEAMGYGNCVLANGTPENIEVIGDAAIIFKKNNVEDLSRKLQDILDDEGTRRTFKKRARIRAAEQYNWDEVTTRYEKLFERMNPSQTTGSAGEN